jgi:hypothetical protein
LGGGVFVTLDFNGAADKMKDKYLGVNGHLKTKDNPQQEKFK